MQSRSELLLNHPCILLTRLMVQVIDIIYFIIFLAISYVLVHHLLILTYVYG